MSFLQPAMLLALPVIALPIIIHLINQRRFHTVPWAAMQFLLAATRMSRGYARLRQWLILAARALAVAGLLFAISRPLSSGWLSLAGANQVDTTFLLLDRSASMTQQHAGGMTKLQSAVDQLITSLSLLRSNRYVLIDSVQMKPIEIQSLQSLRQLPHTTGSSSSADIPAMLELVHQYVQTNRPAGGEVWICSDMRRQDWQPDSGRWDAVRSAIAELPQRLAIHLLAFPTHDGVPDRTLRVTEVKRVVQSGSPQLLLSLRLSQTPPPAQSQSIPAQPQSIPVQLEIDGARSEFTVQLDGQEVELIDHPIPIDAASTSGWGRVSVARDAAPADNEFYFVYDQPQPRKTLIVTDDPQAVRPLEFAASIAAQGEVTTSDSATKVDIWMPDQLTSAAWDKAALVLWQAPIPSPTDAGAQLLQSLVDRGGQVIFFPPREPGPHAFAGLQWTEWQQPSSVTISSWVGDQDLLANTRSGTSLPAGQLRVSRFCGIAGPHTALAGLDGGAPLLARAMTDRRNVYFCATTTSPTDSSLAQDGVVLFVMITRAADAGAQSLGTTRQQIAGQPLPESASAWRQLQGNPAALSSDYAHHAGVYRSDDGLVAVNRAAGEDRKSLVTDAEVARLFRGLNFDRVDAETEGGTQLIQEIWRLFLMLMLIALLAESALCLPRRTTAPAPLGGVS